MNTAATSASTSARPAQESADRIATPEQIDSFERLLRAKLAQQDDDGEAGTGGEATAPSTPSLFTASGATSFSGGAIEMPATGPRSSLGSAFEATLAAFELDAPIAPEAAASWEVSVSEPAGVALEMRATREALPPGSDAKAAWQLTIGSSLADAAMLARHVPRLNEQLRIRANVFSHVRIEGDVDESAERR